MQTALRLDLAYPFFADGAIIALEATPKRVVFSGPYLTAWTRYGAID